MRTSRAIARACAALAFIAAASCFGAERAQAIPIFAQRYHLQCEACHSVLPELNAFGNTFRNLGYQLPLQRHGTTVVALRFQYEYEANPAAGTPAWAPGYALLGNADAGKIALFIHYGLGSQGGPGGMYLAYAASYNERVKTLYRVGLFELPLAQSPGQRLDDLQQYGYYGTHVGLNDLALAAPRWGAQVQRDVGDTAIGATFALGQYQGAPYGGKPVPTGIVTSAATPEVGVWLRGPLTQAIDVGGEALTGVRSITPAGRTAFDDRYVRAGLLAHAAFDKFDFQAEQWWGHDDDADGFGTAIGSSGGYLRLKYYPTPHAYLGIRYDAAENPLITRDMVYYGAFMITPHARFLLQDVQTIGGRGQFGGAVTVGFPWPTNI